MKVCGQKNGWPLSQASPGKNVVRLAVSQHDHSCWLGHKNHKPNKQNLKELSQWDILLSIQNIPEETRNTTSSFEHLKHTGRRKTTSQQFPHLWFAALINVMSYTFNNTINFNKYLLSTSNQPYTRWNNQMIKISTPEVKVPEYLTLRLLGIKCIWKGLLK